MGATTLRAKLVVATRRTHSNRCIIVATNCSIAVAGAVASGGWWWLALVLALIRSLYSLATRVDDSLAASRSKYFLHFVCIFVAQRKSTCVVVGATV